MRPLPSRLAALALSAGSLTLTASPARADDGERVARLQQALDDAEPGASRWRAAWLITHGALTAGQAGLGLVVAHDDRPPYFVGAAKSAIGFLSTLIAPHAATHAGDDLRATPDGRKLARGEQLLDEAADDQRLARGWLGQVGSVVVNGAGALILWRGYHQPGQGALSFVTGMAVAELQFFTVPTGVIGARDDYRVWVGATAGGVAFGGTFR